MRKKIFAYLKVFLFLCGFACFTTNYAQAGNDNLLVLTLKTGDVVIKLRPDLAPKHVERIKQLVKEGAYDHVVFHRVIEGFMAQTGDVKFGKKGSYDYNLALAGRGGSKYPNLAAEFSNVEFDRGTVGMARSSDPDSANSQFFICYQSAPYLNMQYTVIGEVEKGMENVDKIKKGKTDQNGAVENPDEILKAHLEDEK